MARQNVFLDLGFPKHEAAVMLMRCDLAQEIRQWLKKRHLSQAAGADILGISAPRINEIVRTAWRRSRSTTSSAYAPKRGSRCP